MRSSLCFSICDLSCSTLRRAPNSSMVCASGLMLISTGSDFHESAMNENVVGILKERRESEEIVYAHAVSGSANVAFDLLEDVRDDGNRLAKE